MSTNILMADRENQLREILNTLLPNTIPFEVKCFGDTFPDHDLDAFKVKYPLSQSEYRDIQKAVPKREIEYRVGRYLVKKIMGIERLDTATSLYKKNNGAVNWPDNIIGSISHSETSCIAALTNSNQYAGIGIDIEYGNFESDIEKLIATNEELSLHVGNLSYQATLRLIFCCKEALYKSLEAHLSEILDFLDVTIQFLKPISLGFFEFGFRFSREIQGLKTFNTECFYGVAYANEELALSVALLKLKHDHLSSTDTEPLALSY